jgi:hypothetical protein
LIPELQSLCGLLSCVTARSDQYTHIQIKESDPLARLRSVVLTAPSNGDWFAFAPDKGRGKGGQMSPLLAAGQGFDHHRACDAVIVTASGADLLVLYVDLKSGNPSGYAGQFKSTRQFLRYILGLLDEFQGIRFNSLQERYIIFYGGRPPLLNKKPSVPKRGALADSRPDGAYKREVPNGAVIYLKEFLM